MAIEKSLFDKLNYRIKNSVTLKLITIALLILLLLIPTVMIKDIIREREMLSEQVIEEVSSKWANGQRLKGPILTIPLVYEYVQNDEVITNTRHWHILPADLSIDGQVEPEKLRRGIYEVVVYRSDLSVKGNFDVLEVPDSTNLKMIKYDQAFLTIGISDLRGIKNQINFNWDDQKLSVKPGSKLSNIAYSGITVDLPNIKSLETNKINFDFEMKLQGSQYISFVPIGSTTNIKIKSSWNSPSFNGSFLPDNREITDEGFSADWQIFQLNRNFPQSWMDADQSKKLNAAAFGVDLILPMDDYQKSTRSAKYAVMIIALTFLVFFLVEIRNKRKIHPLQYILVGLALILFYTLLVSISEHSNFNFAYGISTLGIVSMITFYSLSIFKSGKLTLLLLCTLTGIYTFLFVTLQLADYALLMGSVGLTLILGATMFFTRKVNWYKLTEDSE